MRRILSIDGGGVRGVIPAAVLAELERRTGRLTRDLFDFVAGTSSGAILTAGIAAGIPAATLVTLFAERSPRLLSSVPLVSKLRRLLTGSMFDTRALHRLIREELGDEAGDWRLNDAPVDLLITTKRLSDGMPWYFVADNPRNSGRAGDYLLADAVTASAAAPTYFAPWTIAGIGELIDGGMGVAGNPVYQACVEAFVFRDDYEVADSVVVSLGTGRVLRRPRPTWLGAWLGWLLSELLRSPTEQQTELVHRHYPDARFYRIDVALEREIGLEEVSEIGELRATGERLAVTIDWDAVLAGDDDPHLVTDAMTLPREYGRVP
jgi:patatin-like phospholipase/acyl hydrolase